MRRGPSTSRSGPVNDDVTERFDIVGFDPRGVGESAPIDCLDDAALDDFVETDGSPDDATEITQLQDQTATFISGCADAVRRHDSRTSAPINVARDLDILRAALGDEVLYYRGASYGTDIGAEYAELFPDRVGRLVLDGAIDPTLTGEAVRTRAGERSGTGVDGAISESCTSTTKTARWVNPRRSALHSVDLARRHRRYTPLRTDDDTRPLTQSLAVLGIVLPLYLSPDEGYPLLNLALERALAATAPLCSCWRIST